MTPAAAGRPSRPELEALGALLAYPGDGFAERAAVAGATLEASAPALARAASPFLSAVANNVGPALEETYARTFDWSATCGLEVGWHLYGEQYERGAFLVAMRARLREAGIDEGTELPDHLGSCLRWLARAEPGAASEFARRTLPLALTRIRAGLGEEDAGYAALLRAVDEAVAAVAKEEPPQGGV